MHSGFEVGDVITVETGVRGRPGHKAMTLEVTDTSEVSALLTTGWTIVGEPNRAGRFGPVILTDDGPAVISAEVSDRPWLIVDGNPDMNLNVPTSSLRNPREAVIVPLDRMNALVGLGQIDAPSAIYRLVSDRMREEAFGLVQ